MFPGTLFFWGGRGGRWQDDVSVWTPERRTSCRPKEEVIFPLLYKDRVFAPDPAVIVRVHLCSVPGNHFLVSCGHPLCRGKIESFVLFSGVYIISVWKIWSFVLFRGVYIISI